MATVAEMHDKFSFFLANIDMYAMSVIESSDDELVAKIQEQLMQGKDGNDEYLRPYAWEEYADYKRTLNPLGVTDWKLTGDFYAHMRVKILDKRTFTIASTGKNALSLALEYGSEQYDKSLTVNKSNILLFRAERFNPFFVELMAAYTGAQANNTY